MSKIIVAILFTVAMAVWLLSGDLTGGAGADSSQRSDNALQEQAEADKGEESIPLVRGMKSVADRRVIHLNVRGHTEANRIVDVKAEISGKVEAVPGEKGSHVKEGDLLCRIAVDNRREELFEARAELESATLEYRGVLDLKDRGLQSEVNVARAKSARESARARVRRAELALQKTHIVAPFDGVVENQPVEVGDYLSPGSVCVTLIEIDPVLVVGEVAEKNIGAVELGDEVDVELITGQKLTGYVSFIGRAPNAATRTYPVEVTVENPDENIRAGLTASMKVPVREELAHLISPASLVLSDDGTVGVRIVDEQDVVHFEPVEVVSEGPNGVWVKGLPEKINIITVGQEEVFDGQVVKIDLSPLASVVSTK
ncbi:MAG: efflux RND transporter periplasmic adaptor subunit [Pseudomonadales bacterium]|nr:efflux RND transporter periplasmic adaptor subunit [Pseudomonadales bacterium]